MPQLASEKFNVAWFKLAEFVQRKEKERALAIYRLLVHSVLDTALISQLEGDLLLSFKDEKAIDLYKRAAFQYEQAGRYLEAALVYEHIIKITAPSLELVEKLFQWYDLIAYHTKKARCAAHLVRMLMEAQLLEKLESFFAQLTLPKHLKALAHESFVLTFLKSEAYQQQPLLQQHIEAALDGFLVDPERKRLNAFLTNLSVLDHDAYYYAQQLLES